MFEFGAIARSTFARPEEFYERLGPFLGELPPGFRYAVEVRNPEYLGAEYFSMLHARNTAHVFNAWTRMPELLEQIAKVTCPFRWRDIQHLCQGTGDASVKEIKLGGLTQLFAHGTMIGVQIEAH